MNSTDEFNNKPMNKPTNKQTTKQAGSLKQGVLLCFFAGVFACQVVYLFLFVRMLVWGHKGLIEVVASCQHKRIQWFMDTAAY
jgi:hypothetical protein